MVKNDQLDAENQMAEGKRGDGGRASLERRPGSWARDVACCGWGHHTILFLHIKADQR
jgi:hypothetical protein